MSEAAETPAAAGEAAGTPAPDAPVEGTPSVTTEPEGPLKYGDREYTKEDLAQLDQLSELRKGAYESMEKAAEGRKFVEAFFGAMNDPAQAEKLLTDPRLREKFPNYDFRQIAENYLLAELEREKMSPEQQELAELKAKEARRQQEEAERRTEAENKELEEKQAAIAEKFVADVTEALDGSGLPPTNGVIRRMAYAQRRVLETGHEIPMAQVVAHVQEELQAENHEVMAALEGEKLLAYIGPELMQKVRAADLARIRGVKTKPDPSSAAAPAEGGDRPKTLEEHLARFGVHT